jgi:hypothetical protein
MAAMVAATALMATARVFLGFSPVCGHAGVGLLTRLELFSPAVQRQQQDCPKSEYQTLHRILSVFLS